MVNTACPDKLSQRSSISTTSSMWDAAQTIWVIAGLSRLGNHQWLRVYQETLMTAKFWPWLVYSVALMSALLLYHCCRKYKQCALIVPLGWENWWWLNIYSRTSVVLHYMKESSTGHCRLLTSQFLLMNNIHVLLDRSTSVQQNNVNNMLQVMGFYY